MIEQTMKIRNRLTRRKSVGETLAIPGNSSINYVRLEFDQVFRLLDTLEKLNPSREHEFDVEQLREDLSDACWLAKWKREYVLMDEGKMSIRELNELLLTDENGYH